MKNTKKMAIITFAVIIGLSLAACGDGSGGGGNGGGGSTTVTFNSVIANGSETLTTTVLTLTFDKEIDGLTAADITLSGVSGVVKGVLSGSNPYTLQISGFSSGGTLNVVVAKSGYSVSGSQKTVNIFYFNHQSIITYMGKTSSYSPNNQYRLTINTNDSSFELQVGTKISSGTAVQNGSQWQWTLSPQSGDSFTVQLTSAGIIQITGIITYNDGTYETAPTSMMTPTYSGNGIFVTLSNVTSNGGFSTPTTTTQITLTFNKEIPELSADDITLSGVSGVNKGTLSGSNPYTLPISGFTSIGTLSVEVAKSGYDIYGSPKTVSIYYMTSVTLNSVTANGSSTQITTELTLTFDNEIDGLSADDITLSGVSGVNKGTLSGSNPYTLPISRFTSSGTLSVTVAKSGYDISGSPKTAAIYNTVSVNFNSNNGSNVDVQIVNYGSTASRPSDPTLNGYVFDYWYSNAVFTIPYNFATTVTANITLYARWISDTDITAMAAKDMVFVSGGTFQMGNPDTSVGNSNERPVHDVTLSGFYMGKYEVTQEQYEAVMGSNPSYFTSSPALGEVQNKRPVEWVSWYDAIVFCNKLSVLEGLTPAYSISGSTDPSSWGDVPTYSNNSTWDAVEIVNGSTGYRLPTEAQWEYAAKGGNGSPGNYTYSGSNTIGDVAWYSFNSDSKTHEVGKKTPNRLGLYDMSGNVTEWCWDWYSSRYDDLNWSVNPDGAFSGSYRVFRGGSRYDSEDVRSAYRNGYYPYYRGDYQRYSDFGFRLARPE